MRRRRRPHLEASQELLELIIPLYALLEHMLAGVNRTGRGYVVRAVRRLAASDRRSVYARMLRFAYAPVVREVPATVRTKAARQNTNTPQVKVQLGDERVWRRPHRIECIKGKRRCGDFLAERAAQDLRVSLRCQMLADGDDGLACKHAGQPCRVCLVAVAHRGTAPAS